MQTQHTSKIFKTLSWTGLGLLASGLVACGGGSGTSSDGTLKLAMTDAPACGYDHVYVTVNKIRVHQSATADDSTSGWQEVIVPTPQKIDLLGLTNGVLQELGSLPMPAGRYEQVRLVLSNATLYAALLGQANASLKARLGHSIGPREASAPGPDREIP